MRGRWFSPRDLRFVNHINREFYDNVVQCVVTIYKVCANETKINVYGEPNLESGLQVFPGIEITTLVDTGDISSDTAEFGPDREQTAIFKFRELSLKQVNLFPEIGDLIKFNERFYSCDNIVQEQRLGSIPEKSFSIIVHTHYARLSTVNIVSRQF